MRRDLSHLATGDFDVVVVGGGICGAAAAWDAAQRGLSVALLERGDFSGATSAESLKVVHGGIRYLQHLDVVRVRESSRERSALLRIAPHLVHPMPFVVPTYGHGMQGGEALMAAFALLSLLTADRNRGIADPARRVPRGHLVSRRRVLEWFPGLARQGLTGAGVFYDGQMYNPPRLVWAFVRSALKAGAVAANYCEVTGFLRRDRRVTGVSVHDRLGGERFEVRGRVVINAAGPYADALLVRSGLRTPTRAIPFSRDMALVLRRRIVTDRALALQTRYHDPSAVLSRGRRHIFLVPWLGSTLVGVSSAVWREDPDRLQVPDAEVDGFLEEINEADPALRLTRDDVGLVMAGLLPIDEGNEADGNVSFGKRPLLVDNARQDGIEGLVTAIVNRYTIARGTAEEAVDLAIRKLGRGASRSHTRTTPLYGGLVRRFDQLVRDVAAELPADLPAGVAERLAHNHGSAFGDVLRVARERPEWSRTIPGSQVLRAEVIHAIRAEMACHLSDCVFRRTDLATTGDPGAEALEDAASLAGGELGWTADQRAAELREVRARFPFAAMAAERS
ncbi:MAG TPA: glycerol-3-phosphate dehydrogenase/oxidase [Gemmatimonadales bacterium]|nr:glycerol-3-phosphate dehydrogenase/oxidase [Gemmatimonadales bacterium]